MGGAHVGGGWGDDASACIWAGRGAGPFEPDVSALTTVEMTMAKVRRPILVASGWGWRVGDGCVCPKMPV